MKETKYELLCNTGNTDYYYTYLDKHQMQQYDKALKEIIKVERNILDKELEKDLFEN